MSENLNSDQQQQLLFMMLLQQHEQIAMMGLGKMKNPVTDRVERDLNSAKYAIDTLVMLEKFTQGNLSKELEGYLRQLLTNLRLNYADEKKKEPAKEQEMGAAGDENAGKKEAAEDENAGKKEAARDENAGKKGAAGDENAGKKGAAGDENAGKKEAAEDENADKKEAAGDENADKKKSSAKNQDESNDKDI